LRPFAPGHKRFYDSDYDFDYNYVASENQPLTALTDDICLAAGGWPQSMRTFQVIIHGYNAILRSGIDMKSNENKFEMFSRVQFTQKVRFGGQW